MFIVIEGCDGTGTTTATQKLAKFLTLKNLDVTYSAEPSMGPIGKCIRDVLNGDLGFPEKALLHMFLADRYWHVEHYIKPRLASGFVVISDRYAYSTWVYQQDLYEKSVIEQLQKDFLVPDLVFILTTTVNVALGRKETLKDIYEVKERQERYRERYHQLGLGRWKLGNEEIYLLDNTYYQAVPEICRICDNFLIQKGVLK